MSVSGPRVPAQTPPIDRATGLFDFRWLRWLTGLRASIDAAAIQVPDGKVQLEAQDASISTTAIPTGALAEGLYRVTVYQHITTAAATSSSLTTTISWTDDGDACAFSGAALTGNTTATVGSFTFMMHIDAATPISYATTYASNGAGEMEYRLDLVLELVSLDE